LVLLPLPVSKPFGSFGALVLGLFSLRAGKKQVLVVFIAITF
jgi:hypothetical protein